MIERRGDLWAYHYEAVNDPTLERWVAITTNGDVNKQGLAVMGRGVALEAAKRFGWGLRSALADRLRRRGNHVFAFMAYRLFTYPVKHHWHEPADPSLIKRSAFELVAIVTAMNLNEVGLVRPGCGNGQLDWEHVGPLITPILDDRFIIFER